MAPDGSPLVVVAHWPYIRRNLELSRRRPLARALDLLAMLQWEAGGEPVPLGRARMTSAEAGEILGQVVTAGVAGAMWNALADAERRSVVVRYRGAGRRAAAWSLRGDVEHWRGMPWTLGRRDVAGAVGACGCSTFWAVAARNPGQSVALRRQFGLSAEDHLRPPGLFPVDSRGNGPTRAATAQRPGRLPVDSRGNGTASAPLLLSSGDLLRDLSLEEREKLQLLAEGIGGPVVGEPLRQLARLAAQPWSREQLSAALRAAHDRRMPDGRRLGVPLLVAALPAILASPAVRGLA